MCSQPPDDLHALVPLEHTGRISAGSKTTTTTTTRRKLDAMMCPRGERSVRRALQDYRPGEVARPVGIETAAGRAFEREAVHAYEVDERVESVIDNHGASDFDLRDQAFGRVAEHPDERSRLGQRNRAVPVFHRGVALAPRLRGFAELQRGLVRETARPPPPPK